MKAVVVSLVISWASAHTPVSKIARKSRGNRLVQHMSPRASARPPARRRAPPGQRAEPLLTQTNDETATPPKRKQTRPGGKDASES